MSLRIAFDLDGVLADLGRAYTAAAERLFPAPEGREVRGESMTAAPSAGGEAPVAPDRAAETPDRTDDPSSTEPRVEDAGFSRRQQQLIWRDICATHDFWTTLQPYDPDVVRRIHDAAARHRWEMFFVTQRPATAGETVQRQTQRWLVQQGFELPSVIVQRGSRGRLAEALELDWLVDGTVEHCVNVIAESKAKPMLVVRTPDVGIETNARRLGIDVCRNVAECLDVLDRATQTGRRPSLLSFALGKLSL